eukprot:1753581-Pleurochrysis_carterae.AAC.1
MGGEGGSGGGGCLSLRKKQFSRCIMAAHGSASSESCSDAPLRVARRAARYRVELGNLGWSWGCLSQRLLVSIG